MNQVAWTLWFHPQLPHCHLTIHLQEPLGERWDEFKKEFNVSKPLWIKTDIVGNNNKHIVHYLQTSQAAFAASSFSSWFLFNFLFNGKVSWKLQFSGKRLHCGAKLKKRDPT